MENNMIDYELILKTLRDNSDKKFDDFNKKIINSGVPTIGCKVPFIRKFAKNFKNVDEVMLLPGRQFVEVDMLKGIVIANCKLPYDKKSQYLIAFTDELENWAVCDISTVKVPTSERENYFNFFCSLLNSEKVFVCRYGLVNLLANYLDNEHIDKVFDKFADIMLFGEYYVDMAVAWLIATAMAKCRDQTVRYMENAGRNVLNASTNNKALQKMRDSYRVSAEDKQWTYSMKR